MIRKIIRIVLILLMVLLVIAAIGTYRNWDVIQRVFLGGVKVYETEAPALPEGLASPAILVFSKTNGFRHEEAIPPANAFFAQLAEDNGWGYFQTENGATFNPDYLARFDAVVFNNVSGDVFTAEQQAAFRDFIEQGGGYVGIHAAGDNSHTWEWYVEDMINAHFIGHPMDPQFQEATVRVEDGSHPASQGLPEEWVRTDEWYSFEASPREEGYHVLATLDETTYSPVGMFDQDLRMGDDHPIIWWHCQQQGRVLYSAMGHQAEAFAEPLHLQMLTGALRWAIGLEGNECNAGLPQEAAGEEETERDE